MNEFCLWLRITDIFCIYSQRKCFTVSHKGLLKYIYSAFVSQPLGSAWKIVHRGLCFNLVNAANCQKAHSLQELGVDIMLPRKRHMLCDFTDCSIFFIWLESLFGLLVLFVMGVSLSIHCILSLFYHLPVMSQ